MNWGVNEGQHTIQPLAVTITPDAPQMQSIAVTITPDASHVKEANSQTSAQAPWIRVGGLCSSLCFKKVPHGFFIDDYLPDGRQRLEEEARQRGQRRLKPEWEEP